MPPFFASLPEALWPEINRRLLCEPALRELTAHKTIVSAWVEKNGDLARWRPGPLGLTALAALEPGAASDPIRWLKTAGRDQLSKAYSSLISPISLNSKDKENNQELPELVRATLAAVALHQRLTATHDLKSLVAETAASPDHYALPLICLYGLLDNPRDLILALLAEAARRLEMPAPEC